MTTQELHPLPPDVWSDPPLAPFQPQLECVEPVTTMEPTEKPPR